MTVKQIAAAAGVSRTTVMAYRRMLREGGLGRLLTARGPGRPRSHLGPDVHAVLANALRHVAWFHVPTFQRYLRTYCYRTYTPWTVRRVARYWEKRLGFTLSRTRKYEEGRLAPTSGVRAMVLHWPEWLGQHGLPCVHLDINDRDERRWEERVWHQTLMAGSAQIRKVIERRRRLADRFRSYVVSADPYGSFRIPTSTYAEVLAGPIYHGPSAR